VDKDYLETLEEANNKDEDIPPIGRDEVEMAIKRLKSMKVGYQA